VPSSTQVVRPSRIAVSSLTARLAARVRETCILRERVNAHLSGTAWCRPFFVTYLRSLVVFYFFISLFLSCISTVLHVVCTAARFGSQKCTIGVTVGNTVVPFRLFILYD
jgi:hypothetical protein